MWQRPCGAVTLAKKACSVPLAHLACNSYPHFPMRFPNIILAFVVLVGLALILFWQASPNFRLRQSNLLCPVLVQRYPALDMPQRTVQCKLIPTNHSIAKLISDLKLLPHPKVSFLQAWLKSEAGILFLLCTMKQINKTNKTK